MSGGLIPTLQRMQRVNDVCMLNEQEKIPGDADGTSVNGKRACVGVGYPQRRLEVRINWARREGNLKVSWILGGPLEIKST